MSLESRTHKSQTCDKPQLCLFLSYIFILSLESQTCDQPQLCLELPPDLIRPPTPPPPQSWLEGSYKLGSVCPSVGKVRIGLSTFVQADSKQLSTEHAQQAVLNVKFPIQVLCEIFKAVSFDLHIYTV